MQRILIVEDDIQLREELKILLQNNGYEAIHLESFLNAKEDMLESHADLILLDIKIPGMSGEYLLKEIRKVSGVPVIMVTSKNTDMDEVLCMSYGADDFITKPYNPTILLLHIEAILKRVGGKAEISRSYRGLSLNMGRSLLEDDSREIVLTKNELGIFCYLLENQGRIVTREELMNYLWDTEKFVDDNTLTVNVTRLRKKHEEAGLAGAIETRRGQGYLLV